VTVTVFLPAQVVTLATKLIISMSEGIPFAAKTAAGVTFRYFSV